MFRSPNDVTSSDPDSSSEEEDLQEVEVGAPLETLGSASETIQGDLRPPTPPTWTQELTPEGHAALMLSSLLQNECRFQAAEILNRQHSTSRFTRDSSEAIELGDQMYKSTSVELASRGVVAGGIESGDWDSTRSVYRDLISHRLQGSFEGANPPWLLTRPM